jgi:outer membrane receptor protein involved in Fe transport
MIIRRIACACRIAAGTTVASLLLALVPSGVARAQAAATADTSLEEIVVTATRRSEVLSHVPISVTALSQESLDIRGIKNMQDLVRYTPGVNIDTSITNQISIRGISSSGGAGTTGIYIDDTSIQMRSVGFNPNDTLPKTFDLDRVEVLRGPQGTLFGAGSEGGTVRYILTAPKLHGSSTYARSELSFTTGGQPNYEFGIAHGMALIDGTLGIRASGWFREEGGWIDRVDPTTRTVTENNANHAQAYMLRLAAVWQPVSTVAVTPSMIYQNSKTHDDGTYWPAYSNPGKGQFNNATPERMPGSDEYYLPALKLELALEHSQIIANTSYYYRSENTAYQGTVYNLSYYQALGWPTNPINDPNYVGVGNAVITGCGSTSVATAAPCDWYPLIDGNGIHLPAGFENYSTPNSMKNNQRIWTQEVRWQSTDDKSRWRWTVGGFWQQAKQESIETLTDPQINQFYQYLYGVSPADVYFGNFYSCPTNADYPSIPACAVYYNNNKTTDKQLAAFGELGYALTDTVRLTVGGRIAHLNFSLDHYADGLLNYGPGYANASSSETASTPKVNVAYQHDADNLFYATYAKGFRAGGGNAPLPDFCNADLDNTGYPNGAPLTYDSDSTQSYEIGSKNNFGPAFRVATSVFYIRWQNIQQNVYVPGACGLQFTDNLGTAVAKGFDLQADLAMGPMKFDVAVGYTDARYTASTALQSPYCPSASTNPCLPLARDGNAISGQASINLAPSLNPPWIVAVGAQYDFQAADRPAFVRFDYQYQSRNNWLSNLQDPGTSQFNANTYTLGSTVFAQLRAGVTLGNWGVSAFVDNLFDTHAITNYQLGQADSFNPVPPTEQQNQYTFRPRTFGLSATLHL